MFSFTFIFFSDTKQVIYGCQNESLELRCPSDKSLKIESVHYGRANISFCNCSTNTDECQICLNKASDVEKNKQKLIKYCEKYSSDYCLINLTETHNLWLNNCSSIDKYLTVKYDCISYLKITRYKTIKPSFISFIQQGNFLSCLKTMQKENCDKFALNNKFQVCRFLCYSRSPLDNEEVIEDTTADSAAYDLFSKIPFTSKCL